MDKNKDIPLQVRNYINRDGCIYHATFARNGDANTNTSLQGTTIAAKLKHIGSVLSDKVVSCTTKWAGNVTETLIEPSSKNGNLNENCVSEYDNYSAEFDDSINEMAECDENRLDDIDCKIAQLENIFIRINADLSAEPQSTCTQTENGCREDDGCMCSGENVRHRMIIDEFSTPPVCGNITLKPVPILGHILDAIVGPPSVTNDKVDRDSNLRNSILKWNENK